ncbi:von Willebrand factor type A domain-containing protein [Mesorhizobium sp. YR577]|nr:von Willebrand factor type A domain-containing protein [Mesorhizobium sp. YR577]
MVAAGHPDAAVLQHHFAMRPRLLADYERTGVALSRHLDPISLSEWLAATRLFYEANAGEAVLARLWQLQRHALPGATAATVIALGRATHQLCLECGSSGTIAVLDAIESTMPYGSDGLTASIYLSSVAIHAARAPEIVPHVAPKTAFLISRLAAEDVAAWFEDGLRLYPRDRAKRIAYFRLEDPLARTRLAFHEGRTRFASHETRLRHLARSLWNSDLDVQELPVPSGAAERGSIRLAGSTVLIPENLPRVPAAQATAFFEAAIMHAMAHRRFTTRRFPLAGMKPMQLALTALIEDARIERLAARSFPGLGRLWRRQHVEPATSARSCASLFARLARALADPDFADADRWIVKGRAMFETAFRKDPLDQDLSMPIARILGHDLGQARIPFPAKSHVVEPAYRDDGLGLFDLDDQTSADPETLEILLDAARMEQRDSAEAPDSGAQAPDQIQSARSQQADAEQNGAPIAVYPEWDYRLQTNAHAAASVFDAPVRAEPVPNWLTQQLEDHGPAAARIRGLVRGARVGRTIRRRHLLDGDELDMEAVHDTRVARRAGTVPDPHIYASKRRIDRDVAIALLIDTSQSTGDLLSTGETTILQMAALSSALTGKALATLGDPFAIHAFSSNGRDDVRLATVKAFGEDGEAMIARLAGLRPASSTRLGAAIRHVATELDRQRTLRKLMIVITDGEPSDIDETDPLYLAEDARQAVTEARRQGLDLFSVALGAKAAGAAAVIFGKRNTLAVERIEDLAARLAGLYFRLTVR